MICLHFWAPNANTHFPEGFSPPYNDRSWLPMREEDLAYWENTDPVLPDPGFPDLDKSRVRRMMREYYPSVHSVDRNLGRILPEYPDNRPNLYDLSLQVPLIIRWPGYIGPVKKIEQTVSFLDVYPTWPFIFRGRARRILPTAYPDALITRINWGSSPTGTTSGPMSVPWLKQLIMEWEGSARPDNFLEVQGPEGSQERPLETGANWR